MYMLTGARFIEVSRAGKRKEPDDDLPPEHVTPDGVMPPAWLAYMSADDGLREAVRSAPARVQDTNRSSQER